MGYLSKLWSRRAPRGRGAAFPAADIGRLTSSWTQDPGAINRWLRYELRTLRARARQLARGDAYGARFIRACVDNIAGADPFHFESRAKFKETGLPNETANEAIEAAWFDRCQLGAYEVTGKLSRRAFDRLVIRCLSRDGEVLIRTVRDGGRELGGEYGAAGKKQILDIDRLDEQKNDRLTNGNTIKMGVEVDRYSKPVAYHVLKEHPGELGEWSRGAAREHVRIPASECTHLFVADWPEQVRGFPWMHAAMVRLWNLGEFEEAAVINARIGASKVAVIQGPEADTVAGANATGKDTAGNLLTDIEPGQYWRLPDGTTLASFDPQFPDAAVGPFIQACLRGAAAACGMAYHSFANDPGQVNYSTARVALLDERDSWMALQQWYIDHWCIPESGAWLSGAILDGSLKQQYWEHRKTFSFQPRTWQWIDPEKEVNADVTALQNQLTSRSRLARQRGTNFDDIVDELAADQTLAASKGVTLSSAPQKGTSNAPKQDTEDPAPA